GQGRWGRGPAAGSPSAGGPPGACLSFGPIGRWGPTPCDMSTFVVVSCRVLTVTYHRGRGRQDSAPAITYTLSGERAMTSPGRTQSWIGALPYAMIIADAALRVIPHPPTFAPIGGLALFGGAALPGVWAFAVPLAALVLSDAVLGFYQGWIWVYGSFALIVLIGTTLRRRRTALKVAGAALASSVVFFAVTNLGEWLGPLYPHTPAGLQADFVAAI